MAHRHSVGLSLTGPDIPDPLEEGKHYHEVRDADRTSSEEEGPGHTHIIDGQTTSGPVPLEDDPEEDARKHLKRKKKKKKKKKKSY